MGATIPVQAVSDLAIYASQDWRYQKVCIDVGRFYTNLCNELWNIQKASLQYVEGMAIINGLFNFFIVKIELALQKIHSWLYFDAAWLTAAFSGGIILLNGLLKNICFPVLKMLEKKLRKSLRIWRINKGVIISLFKTMNMFNY